MRYSKMLIPTLKENPAEAEVASHQLMMRAGMIRRLAAGIYDLLPLGLRVIRKVEKIVREEMDRAGAQEVLLPVMQPAELWKETNRWDKYGDLLLRIQDRHKRDYCFAPTAEEVITNVVRRDIRSYRDLPVNLYQIHTKFRDEIRPRFGLMRSREFIMKDAYSFDADDAGADASYEAMRQAYHRIFKRCGLGFRAVEADSGEIGGSFSSEFMVLADTGEDAVVHCDSCSYAANMEKAHARVPLPAGKASELTPLTKVDTPDKKTIEEVSKFLGVKPESMLKTLIYMADEKPVAVLLRGDHEVNEIKLRNHLHVQTLELADAQTTEKVTGAPVGFAGPVGLSLRMIADLEVENMVDCATGACEKDTHYTGCNVDRDFTPSEYVDLRNVVIGDACAYCEGRLDIVRGIEVGHIFKLGTSYSEAMSCTVLNEKGEDVPAIMGCYGIGIGRVAAACVEQNHDKGGIVWPLPLAPFAVGIVTIKPEGEVLETADKIYEQLLALGIEVLYDDRDERPGVKFKDADLLGIPLRVTVGAKGLKEGFVELKKRSADFKDYDKVPVDDIVGRIKKIIDETLAESME